MRPKSLNYVPRDTDISRKQNPTYVGGAHVFSLILINFKIREKTWVLCRSSKTTPGGSVISPRKTTFVAQAVPSQGGRPGAEAVKLH